MTTTSRDRARRHASLPHWCSCGRVVFGNGGQFQHREMHRRRSDGHHYVTPDAFHEAQEEGAK